MKDIDRCLLESNMHHLVSLIVVLPVKLIVSLLGSNSPSSLAMELVVCSNFFFFFFDKYVSRCNNSRKALTTLALSL
jgi:hypothetical protein